MRTLLFVGSIIFMISATPVFADDTETDAKPADENTAESNEVDELDAQFPEAVLEEVVVQGIASSLRQAADIKRNNVGVMEAITAEDFGKFPDGNLAESLARVPGIAIDRSNVEGQKIAVRGFGPEFNLVTLNGRQMPTAPGIYNGGRSYNFGDIASPGVSAVEVFKAANSTLPSGGIGATVNMVTTKPLSGDGTKKFFSLAFVDDTTAESGSLPVESSLLFTTNQGNWGFSFSGSYQKRRNREEGTRENNWLVPELMALNEGYLRVDSSNPAYTNNNQRADGNTFYQEPTAYQIKDNDRVRKNAQVTLQYAFTDDLVATLDYTYSNVFFEAKGVMFGSWLGGWDTLDATINEHGAYTDVVVGLRKYDHELIWQELTNLNKSTGFNLDWNVTDSLSLAFDAHWSTAEVIGGELNNSLTFTTDIDTNVNHTNGGANGINTFSYDTEFGPENYYASGLTLRDGDKENEIHQYQLNGMWVNDDGGFLKSMQFGYSYMDNKFSKKRMIAGFGAGPGQSPADYDDSLFNRTNLGDFMNSFDPDIGTDYYYRIDPYDALLAFIENNPNAVDPTDGTTCCSAGPIDDDERVYEKGNSAYVQFDMEKVLNNGMLFNAVAGVRYEKTKTESISLYAPPNLLRWDTVLGIIGVNDGTGVVDSPRYGSSSEWLPSLSMSLGLDDNQVVRFSYSKSMARPDLFDMSSRFEIGNQDYFQVTANAGNPDLDPLTSQNFDIAYENYYAEGSYFAVNYFYKKIKNFVGTKTVSGQTIEGLTDPSQSAIGQQAIECVRAWIDAGRPAPGYPGEPGATGDCVSQQALTFQPWLSDFQHMGWVANALGAGVDLSEGYPWGVCQYGGYWRCDPDLEGTANDPLAMIDMTAPYNLNSGNVSGLEFSLQHLFGDSPFGLTLNYTYIMGGDVKADRYQLGEQFVLPGLGDSGNFSVFFENDKHTVRLALNYRGETELGFANYLQPLYVDSRSQIDASYQYRIERESVLTTLFVEVSNINDEPTRLYVRHPEMLFLSQDHGPIYKFGVRVNF